MKVVILAGGLGSRLAEETEIKPKPMVEIGDRPILWHIMKQYSHFGYNEFIVCLGYKGYVIKEFFANYFLHCSDVTFDIKNNKMQVHNSNSEDWKVTLVDTGAETMTGGRIKRIQRYIGDNPFMVTYGDGVSDINIEKLVEFHRAHGEIGTMSSTQPAGRFGALDISSDLKVNSFQEKPKGDGSWINIGFFVFQPEIFDYIENDTTCIFERAPLEKLANESKLLSYKHSGFWQCMDTIGDKTKLEAMWQNDPKWKVWE